MKRFSFLLFLSLGICAVYGQMSYDSVSFETPTDKIVFDPPTGNLWQIGSPQKTFFNSTYAGTKAIVTDTINSFPPGDTSSFIYIIRDPYTKTCLTCMRFHHKYDMDTLTDQGLIDGSYDGGNSWIPLSDTFGSGYLDGAYFTWFSDFHESTGQKSLHPQITSGKSDGWIESTFCWRWFLPVKEDTIILNPDSLMIRFTFISNNEIKEKEGWLIDEIVTSSAGLEICSGLHKEEPRSLSLHPNPFSSKAILSSTESLQQATLLFYNSTGQLVQQMKNLSGQAISIEKGSLVPGLYFIILYDSGNKPLWSSKIIIE